MTFGIDLCLEATLLLCNFDGVTFKCPCFLILGTMISFIYSAECTTVYKTEILVLHLTPLILITVFFDPIRGGS